MDTIVQSAPCALPPRDRRAQARRVGDDLVRHYGRRKFYSVEQVRAANRRSEVGPDFACWSHALFNTHEDFDRLHRAAGEACDYAAMKQQMLRPSPAKAPPAGWISTSTCRGSSFLTSMGRFSTFSTCSPGRFIPDPPQSPASASGGTMRTVAAPILALAVLLPSACTWVHMAPGASAVRVAAGPPAGCESRGEIEVSVKDSIAFYERNDRKVRDELETLARNEAPGLGADTVHPLSPPANGTQRFAAWRCGT